MRGIKNLSVGLGIKQDFSGSALRSKDKAQKSKNALNLNLDQINNDFIQESDNEIDIDMDDHQEWIPNTMTDDRYDIQQKEDPSSSNNLVMNENNMAQFPINDDNEKVLKYDQTHQTDWEKEDQEADIMHNNLKQNEKAKKKL